MFTFVVWKVIFKIPRIFPLNTQFYIIISKQIVLIFTKFYIRKLMRVVFIPNIIYWIITVWNFISINNFSIFSPDIIILYFQKDGNVYPNHYFNESAQFITFADSLFIFRFVENYFLVFFLFLFLETLVSQH